MVALHSLPADPTNVSSTVCRSNAERLMTLSTSAVAVCCCSDSLKSSGRAGRTTSLTGLLLVGRGAPAPLVGGVADDTDLLVCERPNLLTVDRDGADQLVFPEHGDEDQRPGPRQIRQ